MVLENAILVLSCLSPPGEAQRVGTPYAASTTWANRRAAIPRATMNELLGMAHQRDDPNLVRMFI